MLSGGLDSSVTTLLAASELERQGRGRLHTYSVDHEGNDRHFVQNDFQPDLDSPWIEQVSSRARTCHHVVTVSTADLFDSSLMRSSQEICRAWPMSILVAAVQ